MADCVVSQIVIIKGSDRQFSVRVQTDQGDPFDLTGLTEIEAIFHNDDGSSLILTFTGGQIVPVIGSQGKVKLSLNSVQTSLLKAGDTQSFEMIINIGGIKSVVQFVEKLQVVERLFPGVG